MLPIGKIVLMRFLHALKAFDVFICNNRAVTKILDNPTVLRERKKKLLRRFLPEEAPDILKKFMDLIIEKKRERIIEFLYREYEAAANTFRGIIMTRVVSAGELSVEQIERLKRRLEKKLNSKIEIKTELDTNIIGGIQVFIGTNMVDGQCNRKN